MQVVRTNIELEGATISFDDGPAITGDIDAVIERETEEWAGRPVRIAETLQGDLILSHWPAEIKKYTAADNLPVEHDITAKLPQERLELRGVLFTDDREGSTHEFIASDWDHEIEVR